MESPAPDTYNHINMPMTYGSPPVTQRPIYLSGGEATTAVPLECQNNHLQSGDVASIANYVGEPSTQPILRVIANEPSHVRSADVRPTHNELLGMWFV